MVEGIARGIRLRGNRYYMYTPLDIKLQVAFERKPFIKIAAAIVTLTITGAHEELYRLITCL